MSSRYLKVKVNGKWSMVPIPNPYSEYYVGLTCECDRCLIAFNIKRNIHIIQEEE
ncbi:unnamed protein product [marine sediment metagenome]|uniref:Uncharacterized protein n=1 Tax=marine sediment metagenome TaxID=412755 RepID=X1JP16_9ZZZZ